jgi:hypothetical protein
LPLPKKVAAKNVKSTPNACGRWSSRIPAGSKPNPAPSLAWAKAPSAKN